MYKIGAREACDSEQGFDANGCRPLRGLFLRYSNDPGVPLRSTPGFMLSPRFAGSRLGHK
jgi:hypothetical protein